MAATMSPPTSPGAYETRPRLSTNASYLSHRSRQSSHSNQLELIESPRDKKRLNTKADPSVALKEAQPADVALEETNLDDIRRMQHRDGEGNVITDPDRSNPTRYRLERPLDTIRAFNAAAEGTTSRRSSYQNRPSPGYGQNGQDKRSSYYGNAPFSPQQRPRPGAGGYYRHSSQGFRSEWSGEEPAPPQPPYGRPSRSQMQPYHGMNDQSGSPGNSYHQSYETMTSGSDEYGKSTNPSSQNSSFDHLHQMHGRKPDEYGQYDEIQPVQPPQNGYGQYPTYNGSNGHLNRQPQRNGQQSYAPAPAPMHTNARVPIKLTNSHSGPPPTQADLNKALPNKRQSWFKRRISRRDS